MTKVELQWLTKYVCTPLGALTGLLFVGPVDQGSGVSSPDLGERFRYLPNIPTAYPAAPRCCAKVGPGESSVSLMYMHCCGWPWPVQDLSSEMHGKPAKSRG
jgi:hypothetical protein